MLSASPESVLSGAGSLRHREPLPEPIAILLSFSPARIHLPQRTLLPLHGHRQLHKVSLEICQLLPLRRKFPANDLRI
jgi:hypothetical protein